MLHGIAFALVVALAACGGKNKDASSGPPTPSDHHEPRPLADPANESIGGILLNDPATKVETALGAPSTKGEVEEWEATGDRVSMWTWSTQGATFAMGERTDGFHVLSMSLVAPSTLTTSRGIGIGATFAEVDKTYGEFRGKGVEEGEPERWSLEDGIIVGSIYGGTMFTFEGGKVSHIFVGAGAE